MEQMKEMRPKRPAELDRLNMFVGKWDGTGDAKFMGLDETLKTKGTSQTAWDCDGWYLVEHGEFEMGDMGRMHGLGVWTWDAKAKKYRMWWFDNWGATGTGTAEYDESTKTWSMNSKAAGPMGSMAGRGVVKMVDDKTVEWTWTEWPGWDLFHAFKVAEMKGTNKKK